jgi:hypothetical protein
LQNKKRIPAVRAVNWTLVCGNPTTERPPPIERFAIARYAPDIG